MLNLDNILIYGQEDYVARLICYLNKVYNKFNMKTFLFPLIDHNPANYAFDYSRYNEELFCVEKDVLITVAFSVQYRDKAVEHLQKLGFKNFQIYDATMDNELKKEFFKKTFTEQGRELSLVDHEKSVAVYMAKNEYDRPLRHYPSILSKYIIPIQVGAALTNKKIADITDDTGDNISLRNRRYSEITALYWVWKNANADYLGLCHYRRLWRNLDFIAGYLQNNIVDVVLPVPTLCVHSVTEDYMKRYIPDVYPIMLDVLKEMSPDYFEASKDIYDGHIFYACNMLIAKRKVLNSLCEWMFPIVFEIENRVGDLPDPYQNRYAGFCTERLITLYFLYNEEQYHIMHAEKIFIE